MTIGGRWAVVTLERPQGATVERLTPFMAHAEADAALKAARRDSPTPKLLGLAGCKACSISDEGCEVCQP
jgi:hypothetical protein